MMTMQQVRARLPNAGKPRVHGNGFIQVDLDEEFRLHVWGHPSIPRQSVYTPIHDHQFEFKSIVLKGLLLNEVFEWWPWRGGSFKVYQAQATGPANTLLRDTGERGHLVLAHYHLLEGVEAGGLGPTTYEMRPGQIHNSTALVPTVTVIRKQGKTLSQGGPPSRVFVPEGREPDNTFDRESHSPFFLWNIISEVMG